MNQIRILLKILLLQATAIIQVIRLSNYGNFRTVGALSSPGLPTSLKENKMFCKLCQDIGCSTTVCNSMIKYFHVKS